MSTNPFRRSSLKGSSGSGTNTSSSAPIDITDDSGHHGNPLSVNTKVAISTQKHVNFASPPAVPISPASYPPSSPESTRFSPALTASRPILPAKIDYSAAIQTDPFRAGAETDEDDGAIEQAMYNAKVNTDIVVPTPQPEKEDAVKKTLSKFASTPRKPARVDDHSSTAQQIAVPARQSMDVDMFTRLLLTGDSGTAQKQPSLMPAAPVVAPTIPSESSSNLDTASTSQRSMFDYSLSTTEGSSRSSDNSDALGHAVPNLEIPEEKRKPMPPPSRHGKSIKDSPLLNVTNAGSVSPKTQASPEPPAAPPNTAESPRPPPPPPVSRRRSQNSGIARNSSYQPPPASGQDISSYQPDVVQRPPPPPPTRRPGSMIERRTSTDLPPTLEESDSIDASLQPSRKASDSRPPLPPSRNSSTSKRSSLGVLSMTATPPLPPPRRGRGSSRSSIDSQRPSFSALTSTAAADSTRNSTEFSRPEMDSRKVSAASDILADLAALQREVDEARRSAGR